MARPKKILLSDDDEDTLHSHLSPIDDDEEEFEDTEIAEIDEFSTWRHREDFYNQYGDDED